MHRISRDSFRWGGGGGQEGALAPPPPLRIATNHIIRNIRSVNGKCPNSSLVPRPHPQKEEKGLVNLGRILGLALRNFYAPMRS